MQIKFEYLKMECCQKQRLYTVYDQKRIFLQDEKGLNMFDKCCL